MEVRIELGTVVIGPVERPGVPGCAHCMELRRRRARQESDGHRAVWQRHAGLLVRRPSSWLTGLGCQTVGILVADEVSRLVSVHHTPRTACAALYVDLEQLGVILHRMWVDGTSFRWSSQETAIA